MKYTIKYIGFVLAAAALIFAGASSVSANEGFNEGLSIHYDGATLERYRALSGGENK